MIYTAAEALKLLEDNPGDYDTPAKLRKLVSQVSIERAGGGVQGSVTVLYSNSITQGGVSAHDVILEMIKDDADVRVIDRTEAGEFMSDRRFKEAAVQAFGKIDIKEIDARPSDLNDFFYEAKTGIWADTSKRFADATVGEVRVLGGYSASDRTFALVELPALFNNSNVTMIDGVDIDHLRTIGGERAFFDAVKANAMMQMHFSDLSVNNYQDYLSLTHEDLSTRLSDPTRFASWNEKLSTLNANNAADFANGHKAAMEAGSILDKAGWSSGLNKLGFIGIVLGLASATNDATAAALEGREQEAKEIMKLWALDAAASGLGEIAGGIAGTVVAGLLVAGGVTLSAPLIGALALGGSLVGGILSAEGAKELYDLMDDRDGTGQRDIIDRLEMLWYGQTYTLSDPPPADMWGERQKMDASLTKEQILEAAKTDIAWRYAIRELNPFVIVGPDYTKHNLDGSLDNFDEITNPNGLTEAFLKDRIDMLLWKMRFDKIGAKDDNDLFTPEKSKTYDEDWDSDTVQGNWDYVDHINQLPGLQGPLTLAIDGKGISLHDHQIIFGKNKPGEGDTLEGEGDDDRIYGLAGNDTIKGDDGNDYLEGNAGDDWLYGNDGNDILKGGAGKDILWGGEGNDALHGGAGDDNLGGESGNDFLNGGSGTDVLIGGDDNDYLLETVGDNFTTMYGDAGNDILEVSAAKGDTILKGGAGNDIILAGGGTNSIEGGNDNDLIRGNNGSDIIDGGDGADNIEGSLGDDAITGATGADYLRGGAGNDSYFYADANFGTDLIEDTQGNDQLNIEDLRIGSASYDAGKLAWIAANGYEIRQYNTGESTTLAINAAGDTQNTIYIRNWTAGQFGIVLDGAHSEPQRPDVSLQGAITRAENNYVDYLLSDAGDGGQGNDFVRGTDAASVLTGGIGNDILDGRGGDDWIEGGEGNDVILTGEGKDVALGGGGNDIIRAGYKWDMERGSYVDTGVPVVYYQAGSGAGNWLRTNPRTDIALYYIQKNADGSQTTIYVDAHPELALFDVSFEPKLQVNETYSGYMYWWNTGDPDASIEPSLNIKLTLGNSEKVGLGTVAWEDRPSANFGKPLSFELNLGNAKSVLAAGTGEAGALLRGGTGNDVIYGANNSDKLYGEADDDLLVGYGGDDELYGGDGRDELSGGSGRDFLDGGEGNDELIGGFGADVLYGGAGDDALSGDAVSDRRELVSSRTRRKQDEWRFP